MHQYGSEHGQEAGTSTGTVSSIGAVISNGLGQVWWRAIHWHYWNPISGPSDPSEFSCNLSARLPQAEQLKWSCTVLKVWTTMISQQWHCYDNINEKIKNLAQQQQLGALDSSWQRFVDLEKYTLIPGLSNNFFLGLTTQNWAENWFRQWVASSGTLIPWAAVVGWVQASCALS